MKILRKVQGDRRERRTGNKERSQNRDETVGRTGTGSLDAGGKSKKPGRYQRTEEGPEFTEE